MNPSPDPIRDDELHAFVDGLLAPERAPAVLAWLGAHAGDAARVAEWQAQRLALRQLARQLELGEAPAALTERVRREAGGTPPHGLRRAPLWTQAVAALLLLAIGVAGGWGWGRRAAGADALLAAGAAPAFVHEAWAAHAVFVPETRHPVEVAAADQAHLVQWLSRRLGAPLKVPSLVAEGYQLLGGRLLPGDGVPRAQFMYQDAGGTRVTLYVAVFAPGQGPAETAFRSAREGDGETFYWVDDRFGYALSGQIPAARLQRLARAVYTQLGA